MEQTIAETGEGSQFPNEIACKKVSTSSQLTSSPFAERSNTNFMHNTYRMESLAWFISARPRQGSGARVIFVLFPSLRKKCFPQLGPVEFEK